MRRRVAYLFYSVALVAALTSLGSGAAIGGFFEAAFGILGAIAVWWIAAGFGVRLGVTPDDFATSAKKLLGFGVDYDLPAEASPSDTASTGSAT